MSKTYFPWVYFGLHTHEGRPHTRKKTDRVVSACQTLSNESYVSIREVAQTIGLLVSSLPAVHYRPLFHRNIEIDKNEALYKNKGNYEALIKLSPEPRQDLSWWVSNLPHAYKQIDISNPDVEITTDASKLGCGAVCLRETTQGLCSESKQLRHINDLEILAVHFALRCFQSNNKGKHVKVNSDNSTTVCYINAMGGTKSPSCNKLVQDIWTWCMRNKIWLTASHLPGVLNVEADKQSRQFNERTEWHLREDVSQQISKIWATPDIDLLPPD